MRVWLILCLFLLPASSLFAQVDSLPETFFPSHVGDIWNYRLGSDTARTYQTELIRDSVGGGLRYLFFDGSKVPAYEIDSVLNVVGDPTTGYRALQYELPAKKGDTWHVRGAIVARVDDVFWDFVLGKLTQVKRIGYYSGVDTTFSIWFYDHYLAAGFGRILDISEASQSPNAELVGCVIDGIAYGYVLGANDFPNKKVPQSYKLFPAFPNPFNPSTTIRYVLPRTSQVSLKVYNTLGQEVATLVNETKPAGVYTVQFDPANLASGMYFYRLQVGGFVQTRRLLLLR